MSSNFWSTEGFTKGENYEGSGNFVDLKLQTPVLGEIGPRLAVLFKKNPKLWVWVWKGEIVERWGEKKPVGFQRHEFRYSRRLFHISWFHACFFLPHKYQSSSNVSDQNLILKGCRCPCLEKKQSYRWVLLNPNKQYQEQFFRNNSEFRIKHAE